VAGQDQEVEALHAGREESGSAVALGLVVDLGLGRRVWTEGRCRRRVDGLVGRRFPDVLPPIVAVLGSEPRLLDVGVQPR